MGMYCDQCQESVKGTGCIARGVCGKSEVTAKLQDTLVYALEGVALCAEASDNKLDPDHGRFLSQALFITVTNTNFDDDAIVDKIFEALALRDELRSQLTDALPFDAVNWLGESKEIFGLDDINDLPISYDIAWYEQKAVAVLLALLSLGVKGIRLGPTLPEFLTTAVVSVLVDKFDIKPIGTVQDDVFAMMAGQ